MNNQNKNQPQNKDKTSSPERGRYEQQPTQADRNSKRPENLDSEDEE